jgi:hypothetical protein
MSAERPIWTVLATDLRSAKGVRDGGSASAICNSSLTQCVSGDPESSYKYSLGLALPTSGSAALRACTTWSLRAAARGHSRSRSVPWRKRARQMIA